MEKARVWSNVCYPESLPSDWLDKLRDLHIPCFISPLHNMDVDENGELKKPHYHIMLIYESPVTYKLADEDFKSFGSTTLVKRVRSTKGMARYLCHLDEKDKYHYSVNDVQAFAGADYNYTITTEETKQQSLFFAFDWIDENNCVSFYQLCKYFRKNNPEIFEYLLKNTATIIAVKEYQKSLEWEINKNG